LQIFEWRYIPVRVMALVNGDRNVPPHANARHAELQKVFPNRFANANDPIYSRIEQI